MTGRTRPLAQVPGLLDLADAQLGVVHRDQLTALGVNTDHVRSQLRAQRWQTVGPRVVALMTGALVVDQLRWAALLHAGRDSCLDALTALQVHGLRAWEPDTVEVLLPHGAVVSPLRGTSFHRSRHVDGRDVVLRHGMRCATPARAAVDAASRQRFRRSASGLILAVVQQRLATPAEIVECLDRLTKVRFVDTIREAAEQAAAGADALSEVDVSRLLRRAGLNSFRRQHVVMTADGPRPYDIVVDLPGGGLLLVEVDGPTHDDPLRRAADLAKDAAAVAQGHQVLRVPASLVRMDGPRIQRQLESIRRAAERRFGSGKSA